MLVEDLTVQRTAALRLGFANNHHVALVHALLLQTVLTHSRDHSCLDIVLTSRSVEVCMKAPQNSLAIANRRSGHSIDAVKDKYDFRKMQRAHAEVLADALDFDMTNNFEGTAEGYANHLARDRIEAALMDIEGPGFASGVGRMKKAEAAAYAEAQTKRSASLPSPSGQHEQP